MRFNTTVPYQRASLFAGLPAEYQGRMEQVLDNRLSSSSWRTIKSAVKRWKALASTMLWHTVIATDDAERGGKLVTFVLDMVDDSTLAYATIEQYVGGGAYVAEASISSGPCVWDHGLGGLYGFGQSPHVGRW